MRKIRREMPPDVIREKNDQIFRRLVATQQYRRAKTVVLYVSKELEVDTRRLIKRPGRTASGWRLRAVWRTPA